MSSRENSPDEQPDDDRGTSTVPEEQGDGPVDFGIEVLDAALDRQVSCRHGFDPQYCPFGCV